MSRFFNSVGGERLIRVSGSRDARCAPLTAPGDHSPHATPMSSSVWLSLLVFSLSRWRLIRDAFSSLSLSLSACSLSRFSSLLALCCRLCRRSTLISAGALRLCLCSASARPHLCRASVSSLLCFDSRKKYHQQNITSIISQGIILQGIISQEIISKGIISQYYNIAVYLYKIISKII